MLDALRLASKNWIGKLVFAGLLALMIIGLGNWGVGYVSVNFGANQLVRVGDTDIGIDTYHEAYQRALQNLQQRLRQGITDAQARQFGLNRQVLSQIVSGAVLDQQGKRLGLAMSDKDLAQSIVEDDRFKPKGLPFDRRLFEENLREMGMTERHFTTELRSEYLRQEQTVALQQGLTVPTAMLEAMNRYANETRSIDYVVLPASAAGDIGAPSAEQLQAFYDIRRNLYKTPEYRKLTVLTLTPAALAKSYTITDDEAEKLYNELKATRFIDPEKRKIQQILLPDEATAQAASDKLAAGATFETIAAEYKIPENEIELGTLAKSELDKAAGDAAFSLAEGAVSKPVKTQFGWVLLRVTGIVPGHEKPFAEVKDGIKNELAVAKARKDLVKLHDLIEDRRSAGKTLTEAAVGTPLTPRTIEAVDANGHDKNGQPIADLADPQALVKAAFASDVGVDNEPIDGRDGSTTWFEIVSVERARQQTLDEVKPLVEEAWRQDERGRRLADKATEMVKKLKDGEKLETLAAAEGNLEIKHNGGIKRAGTAGFSQTAIVQIFNVNVGDPGMAPDEAGGRIVFKVLDAAVPPLDANSADFSKLSAQVKDALDNDVVGEYLEDLHNRLGVSFNQRALQTVLSGAPAENQ